MQGWVFLLSLFQFLFSIFRQSRAELACGEVFQGGGEKGKLETRRQKLESGGKYAEWRVVGGEWREEEEGERREIPLFAGRPHRATDAEKKTSACFARDEGGRQKREGR